jgi:3-phosphoshikimate 1-carboxyvinyltransferase
VEHTIQPVARVKGDVTVPGDKSVSIRALLCGALCDGDVDVQGLGTGEDVLSARRCLAQLGVNCTDNEGGNLTVHGQGMRGLQQPDGDLDCGNSGTTMRLFAGALAGQDFPVTMSGDASLSGRPMDRIAKPMRLMGAQCEGREERTLPPLLIRGGSLKGMTYQSPVASAQVKSAVLLAGLYADDATVLEEPSRSRDHTERMLQYLGADVDCIGNRVEIQPCENLTAKPLEVPGDISAAAFLLAAAVLVQDGRLTIRNVGMNPTRTGIIDMLGWMNVPIAIDNLRDANGEPVADLTVAHAAVQPTVIDGKIIPRIIDELPIIAVMAAAAEGTTEIRDAEELRVKETDRIAVVVENLRRMGVDVDEREDGMVIRGGKPLQGARIESHGDHRIAMAFAVAGLIAQGETVISGAEWADISFPGFFALLDEITAA